MIQSFRRDVRSITGATHKGTLKHKQPSLLLGFLIVFAITWMAFTRVIPMERWVLTLHELQREVLEEEIPAVAKTTPEAERFAFTIEDVVLAGSTPQVSPDYYGFLIVHKLPWGNRRGGPDSRIFGTKFGERGAARFGGRR
nr:PREDICTED: uncharacterized protein LOC105676396 isoform X3 [Linepithema humile]